MITLWLMIILSAYPPLYHYHLLVVLTNITLKLKWSSSFVIFVNQSFARGEAGWNGALQVHQSSLKTLRMIIMTTISTKTMTKNDFFPPRLELFASSTPSHAQQVPPPPWSLLITWNIIHNHCYLSSFAPKIIITAITFQEELRWSSRAQTVRLSAPGW